MKKSQTRWLAAGTLASALAAAWTASHQTPARAEAPAAGPVPVRVARAGPGFQLQRGGSPYFIKGAGGDGPKAELKAAGANSWRTWGADHLEGQLAEARTLGMTVTVGIWLGHSGPNGQGGFNYHDAQAVAAQKEMARQAILRYKDSPAVLAWALGNEMENGQEDNAAMWDAIEDIARMAHQLDPNHPTMTVVAELGGDKVKQLNAHCPDIDILGINTYAGGPSIGERYKAAGGIRPYVVTEFGPPGTWESPKNAWGVVPELTSTEKAARYRETYEKGIAGQPLCLGSYAFTWGSKQEASATWFGLRLPDGSRLGAVDALSQEWTGHPPARLCPAIKSLAATGPAQTAPNATVRVSLDAASPQNDPLTTQWVLQADPVRNEGGGETQAVPPTFPQAIVASDSRSATLKMPRFGGPYRLYAYVRDGRGGAAVANVSLNVAGGPAFAPDAGRKASLPLVLYGAGAAAPFVPSGFMGNAADVRLDPVWPDRPHSGKTCLRLDYYAPGDWGGVVWQNPENNWGDRPGGWDLSGAKALSFWARGDKGGEAVSFSFGLVGKGKTYPDTGTGKLGPLVLTPAWTRYTIDVKGQDLSRIVTGFCWTVAGAGHPVRFYLDDIRFE